MLIEFSVGNYRSFKEKVTLSMVAANLVSQDKQVDARNVFTVNDDLKLLKSGAIYGANASGKSNLAKALRFMRWFVINSSKETQSRDSIPVEPFRLSIETESDPSIFEIIFIHEKLQYRYGFEVDSSEVISEWLFYVPRSRETRLFERHRNQFEFSKKLDADGLEKRTRNNALFLSVCAQFNVPVADKILGYYNQNMKMISGLMDEAYGFETIELLDRPIYKEKILGLVRKLDIGFEDINIIKIPIEQNLKIASESSSVFVKSFASGVKTMVEELQIDSIPMVRTLHTKFNGLDDSTLIAFDLEREESEGTQKIFALSGPLVDALENGKILIIDEFDARLHPLISQEIIKLFNSNETNPHNAQLIFMTHDTNLLSNKLFRRDQIWFTEKNQYGATDLYSLAEYKVRNDASFEKDYIKGRYGAIPYIKNLSSAFLETDA